MGVGQSPAPRKGAMCASTGDGFLVFGGLAGRSATRNDTWILEAHRASSAASSLSSPSSMTRTWHYATDLDAVGPGHRWKSSLSRVPGERMILFGGSAMLGGQEVYFNDVWELQLVKTKEKNTKTKQGSLARWTLLGSGPPTGSPTWPSARRAHSATALGQDVIIFGGKDAVGHSLKDSWAWNARAQRFRPLAQFPGEARKGHSSALFPARSIGGSVEWSPRWGKSAQRAAVIVYGGRKDGHKYLGDVHAYVPSQDKWLMLHEGPPSESDGQSDGPSDEPDMPGARNHHVAVVKDRTMVMTGGRRAHRAHAAVDADLWGFDVVAAQWARLGSDAPVARIEGCAALHGQDVMLFGGQDVGGFLHNDVWALHLDTGLWEREAPDTGFAGAVTTPVLLVSLVVFLLGALLVAFKFYAMRTKKGYVRVF